MINPKIIEYIFSSASIQRWNDYPRMVDLVELDKQAHKFIIAYFIAKLEDDINFTHLIEAGIFEFLRRVVVTDIRPDVFRKALQQKSKEINTWVVGKLKSSIENIENGNFLQKFEEFLNDPNMYKKERFILKAASYLSTKWEFSIVYQTSQFLSDIEEVKKAVDAEIEDYYELIGVRKIALNKKLAKIVDLSGRLRFQKRWAQTPRIPETSVLGHMLTVALFSYFYSLEVKACDKRLQNNFFTALFHDLPEALTRDIISPVKYSVDELSEIIAEYEVAKIEDDILPNIPINIQEEFSYILGISKGIKEEFANKVKIDGNITEVDDINKYNLDKYEAIDGLALKQCDKLSAFVEASLSISHGIKSKELISGKKEILKGLKEINGVDFKQIALDIDSEFGSNGQIQTTLDFE
ncbi:HD domain-containing protein [Aliarcobacter cryaerophilus]|uniref:HD domain-containing protein n=6 Tax=Arcobacteraceae TaxID=2808963 RepID=A0AA96DU01_9BACT|nr:HD domain-containing protein [Aliarcobacter cryaerophilus]NCB10347.1 HD domain-containing protein [Erysipelotrichia bacterium]OQA75960.1 MAG: 5'-nucleotidase [Candidatus Dependentiae bacterium ADurb.Bin246]WNL27366.1 HD domain-containing protein [Arcobacter sp. AZ-2023]WPD05480.1 HD domain-containing protein [Arcobacter sp. DSM 115956]WPD07572.1 HD domain-containing protein [Arcobacter sp. DSM 115955]WPD12624.1 HD domain-containing protein [Arcobacter sp. DSM 115960]